MKKKYDTPEKKNQLAASMDTFFRQLRGPMHASKLAGEATVVPSGPTPVLYLPASRLSFGDDASIKGARRAD